MGGGDVFIGEFFGEWGVYRGVGCLWEERRGVHGEVCIYGRWTYFWEDGVKGGGERRGEGCVFL